MRLEMKDLTIHCVLLLEGKTVRAVWPIITESEIFSNTSYYEIYIDIDLIHSSRVS